MLKRPRFVPCSMPRAAAVAALAICPIAAAQSHLGSEQIDGMRPVDLRTHAITDAKIVIRPGETIESGTIVIHDGVITAVGPDVEIPASARVWPADGSTVYPGLIDAAVFTSLSTSPSGAGAHWNSRITPQINIIDEPAPGAALRKQLRDMGFAAAAFYADSGIVRGTGAVLSLAEEDRHVLSYRDHADMLLSLESRGRGGGGPGSLMGVIALARQTLLDAQWYADSRRVYRESPEGHEPPMRADALEALEKSIQGEQRVLLDAGDELNLLRLAKIAEEFNLNVAVLGSGVEFRRLADVLALDLPMIVPLDYPARPTVSTPAEAMSVSLRELMTWEQAPTNARRLVDGGATIALTTERLRRRSTFFASLKKAIGFGLSEEAALAALTTTPAELLGLDDVLGTIEPGKAANLVVVKGSLFEERPDIRDVWVNGRRHEVKADPDFIFAGKGELTIGGMTFDVEINSERNQLRVTLGGDDDAETLKATRGISQGERLAFVVDGKMLNVDGYIQLAGVVTDRVWRGAAVLPDGSRRALTLRLTDPDADAGDDGDDDAPDAESPEDSPTEDHADPLGSWTIEAQMEGFEQGMPVTLMIERSGDGTFSGTSSAMGETLNITDVSFDAPSGRLTYAIESPSGRIQLAANVSGDTITGAFTGDGVNGSFAGERDNASQPGAAPSGQEHRGRRDGGDGEDEQQVEMPPDDLPMPFGAFGLLEPPTQQNVIVRSATIWTCGPAGVLERADMVIEDGTIVYIGRGDVALEDDRVIYRAEDFERTWSSDDQPRIIDATDKHVTPGMQDCHSHTGITGGVNEFNSVNTAEVRISDVIDPDDVNWYRQLAGGLTLANQLHGSANPIGGQNSVVKLRWGAAGGPDAMRVQGAPLGIKFALGENVIRSTNRYPNTRMGVEAIYRDGFTAAREYAEERERYNAMPDDERARTMPPRRDLELDALAQILRGEMLVHCHSYRQDEILMLIRVAEAFGFTIGTFQHVLEGYKVAEAIAAHGAGASSFSDWWGYKVEVQDAIPHNGAILHSVGVVTTFNSDSSELARRMNTEAAKAVRYGEVEPHEALKFVTLNVARQLGIGDRTGSLEVGKDADFVIWSDHPLSTYTMCEQTWIEGTRYFDLDTDRQLRERAAAEHRRLVQKVLADQHGEAEGSSEDDSDAADDPAMLARNDMPLPPSVVHMERTPERALLARYIYHQQQRYFEQMLREGRDPDQMRPGDCGCGHLDWWSILR